MINWQQEYSRRHLYYWKPQPDLGHPWPLYVLMFATFVYLFAR
jgi:hypothetical protein